MGTKVDVGKFSEVPRQNPQDVYHREERQHEKAIHKEL